MQKTVVVIVGPTAIGKTAFAIFLAKYFNSEIISADSRQVYKEMKIGTSPPTKIELDTVPHHLIGHISIQQNYTVADFAKEASAKIKELFKRNELVILTGGSGLYIDAVCNGLDDLPDSNPTIKANLTKVLEQEGIKELQKKLFELDPEYYRQIDLNNPHRLIRAIEVCLLTGKKFSDLRSGKKIQHSYRIVKIGLQLVRETLYERINFRVEQMLNQGLVDEATKLFSFRDLKALKTVGYSEIFSYLENKISLEQAKLLIQQNTRRYAKRQMTWFRKDPEINWIEGDEQEMLRSVEALL